MTDYKIVSGFPIVPGIRALSRHPVVALLSVVFDEDPERVRVFAGELLPDGEVIPVMHSTPDDRINWETFPPANVNPDA